MHSNPAFRRTSDAQALAAARNHGVGILTINGTNGPLASHIPFDLAEDDALVVAHLARANPILRLLQTPQPALLAVSLGEAYVSPDWYALEDQVPTLNYIAIHLRGTLATLDQDSLRAHLDALSGRFEARLEKQPWTSDKMSAGLMERMMRAIVPVALRIDTIESTWKLSQNKPPAARLNAADHVQNDIIAAAMRAVNDD